ncbi:NAD(P)-dependent oxidoreductase [Candidatus Thioglobus sp.]|nr:NAD(P)-dependent oxidoreductase [Candidatus Thioglobus sp.]
MNKQKILVCGATGFIGRNIAEHFSKLEGFEVYGVHNKRPTYKCPNLNWIKADLNNTDDIDKILDGVDIIIQAAATTSGSKDIVARPYIHVTDNAVMNSLLFRAAFAKKVKHVIFFSCTVMLQSSDKPQTEEDYNANMDLHPRYFGVGHTKLYLEKMCDFYSRIGETKFTVIRHTNIYGPYDKFDLEHSHVFGATITKVLSAKDGNISVWGTGEEERDLLYVDDLVNFVGCAINNQKSQFGLYNCGYGNAISIKDLVDKVILASGKALTISHDLSQPTIKTSLSLDCKKAEKDLGWSPETSIDDGIIKTISWWNNNFKKSN